MYPDNTSTLLEESLFEDNINADSISRMEYLDTKWYIGAQNVNSLKDITKQTLLFNIMDQEGINVLIASETNINRNDIKAICKYQSDYQVFFIETLVKEKKKGFDIAIFLDKEIGKHVFKQIIYNTYGLVLKLLYKGKHIINIIGLYCPTDIEDNKSTRLQLIKWTLKLLKDASVKGERSIIGGDFNCLTNIKIDRALPTERSKSKHLHNTMEKHAMFDTFRIMNKHKKEFTYEQ